MEGENAPALLIKDSVVSPFGSDVFNRFILQLSSSILSGKSRSRGIVLVASSRIPSFHKKVVDVNSSCKWFPWLDGERERASMFYLTWCLFLEMVRHASAQPVAHMISSLRSNDLVEAKVASMFYLSSMVALVEPLILSSRGRRLTPDNLAGMDENMWKAKFLSRLKRRNGRVRLMQEELIIDRPGVTFTSVLDNDPITAGGLVPKVQFNLQLSEKEQVNRPSVVLPFEHQDRKGEVTQTGEAMTQTSEPTVGELLYVRDSDDEMPDSDEDPDDDLDI